MKCKVMRNQLQYHLQKFYFKSLCRVTLKCESSRSQSLEDLGPSQLTNQFTLCDKYPVMFHCPHEPHKKSTELCII
jgi:hypothetical protein